MQETINKNKYLHILLSELNFSQKLICLIQTNKNMIDPSKHFFVVFSKDIYVKLKQYEHVVLFTPKKEKYAVYEIINHMAEDYDFVFVHGFSYIYGIYRINPRFYKKIIWRTWGHDVIYYDRGTSVKNLLKKSYERFVVAPIASRFRAIGVANNVDILNLKKHHIKKIPFYVLRYTSDSQTIDYCGLSNYSNKESYKKILIGHSALVTDNHFCVIDKLKKYRDEQVRFYFPLAYGNKTYAKEVKEYASINLGTDKCIFFEEFVSLENYVSMLAEMDVAIFDGTYSYALGNLAHLIKLKKKIYLNKNGIIAEDFLDENIPFNYTEEIGKQEFKKFIAPVNYPDNIVTTLFPLTLDEAVELWVKCLNDISEMKK